MTDLSSHHLTLGEYLERVKSLIHHAFAEPVWVRAEVRSIHHKGGHYYFELAQNGDDDSIVASCRATLWRYHAHKVLTNFQAQTGRPVQAGTSLLLKGVATFHPQYGFSFNIQDIDPNFTLGELASAYHAMLRRLDDEGLSGLNKALPLPFDVRHVIVISPERGAGLGDFRAEADRLAKAGACHFYYHHATFQGNHAPQEIRIAIINAVTAFKDSHQCLPDLIVVIRGGGAVGDLAYLNDYELATLLAEQQVPVWVGIGHERDRTLIDHVAHTSFDTPSKVIYGIQAHLTHATTLAKDAINRLHTLSTHRLKNAQKALNFELRHLKTNALYQTRQYSNHLHDLLNDTQKNTKVALHTQKSQLKRTLSRHQSLTPKLHALRQHCRHVQSLILLQHPKHTLQKGYALVYKDGAHINTSTQLTVGDTITLTFCDGKCQAVIQT